MEQYAFASLLLLVVVAKHMIAYLVQAKVPAAMATQDTKAHELGHDSPTACAARTYGRIAPKLFVWCMIPYVVWICLGQYVRLSPPTAGGGLILLICFDFRAFGRLMACWQIGLLDLALVAVAYTLPEFALMMVIFFMLLLVFGAYSRNASQEEGGISF